MHSLLKQWSDSEKSSDKLTSINFLVHGGSVMKFSLRFVGKKCSFTRGGDTIFLYPFEISELGLVTFH